MAKGKGKDLIESQGKPPTIQEQSTEVAIVQPLTLEEQTNAAMTQLMPKAGTITLTKKQEGILYAPINEEDIEIRPDGMVYLPWREYEHRMRKAFGSKWTMLPGGNPQILAELILQAWWLIIDGCPYGYVHGEQRYIPSNRNMSYGDALEGTKSNALMRLCKGLGIGTILWKKSFTDEWKKKHAEKYFDKKKDKWLWRKKGVDKSWKTKKGYDKTRGFINDLRIKEKNKAVLIKGINADSTEEMMLNWILGVQPELAEVDVAEAKMEETQVEEAEKEEFFPAKNISPPSRQTKQISPDQQDLFDKLIKSHIFPKHEAKQIKVDFLTQPSEVLSFLQEEIARRKIIEKMLDAGKLTGDSLKVLSKMTQDEIEHIAIELQDIEKKKDRKEKLEGILGA